MPRGKFDLFTDPRPLPDNDEPAAPPAAAPVAAAELEQPARPKAQRARAAASPADKPEPQAAAGTMPPAATTVRLRPSAAEPLNAAWLNERRNTNPKLSYPEFASMIVSLGLAAYDTAETR